MAVVLDRRGVRLHHRRRGKSGKPGPAVHDDLLATVDDKGRVTHDFVGAACGPNQVWLTDISEHPTREGKLYLCAVKDVYSNKIVGYEPPRCVRRPSSLRLQRFLGPGGERSEPARPALG